VEWGAIEEGEMRGVAVEVAGCRWARAERRQRRRRRRRRRSARRTSVRGAEIKDDRRLFSRMLLHGTSEFAMTIVVLFYFNISFYLKSNINIFDHLFNFFIISQHANYIIIETFPIIKLKT